MINEWEDYYRILQVHFMAEPEIIKSAYLRLSKKYHPDSNYGYSSEEKMKSINKAYSVLSNPDTRNEYALKWVEKLSEHNNSINDNLSYRFVNISTEPAQSILLNYLLAISNCEYELAYELLTNSDKNKISKKEFVRWQTLVGEVFQLISFNCDFHSMYKDIKINKRFFETCIKIHVKVVERNNLMDRIEEDEFYKNIVYENDVWRIYLGYTNLRGIIDKFNTLALLNKQKAENSYHAKLLPQSKKIFLEMAQREQMRYNRHGNIFSLIICKMNKCYMEDVEQVMIKKLRKLDFFCRWNSNTQLIVLPETDEKSAQFVTHKIKQALECLFGNKEISITFIIIQQQYDTLEDLMVKILD
ncbi:MAG: DnaJ domain-containing protein [Mobilitalea sp.]